jgi:hypothetical protein
LLRDPDGTLVNLYAPVTPQTLQLREQRNHRSADPAATKLTAAPMASLYSSMNQKSEPGSHR